MDQKTFVSKLLAAASQLGGMEFFNIPNANGQSALNPEALKMYWLYVSKRLTPAQIEQAFDLLLDEDEFPRAKAFVQLVLGSPQSLIASADGEWLEIMQAIAEPGYRPKLSVAGAQALAAVGGLYSLQELPPAKRSNVLWNFRDLYKASALARPGSHAIQPDRVPCLPGPGGNSPQLLLSANADPGARFDALATYTLNYEAATPEAKVAVLAAAAEQGFSKEEVIEGRLSDAPDIGSAAAADSLKKIAAMVRGLAEARDARRPQHLGAGNQSPKEIEDRVFFETKRDRWVALQGLPSFTDECDRLRGEIQSMTEGTWIHPTVVGEIESWLEAISADQGAPDRGISAELAERIAQEMSSIGV